MIKNRTTCLGPGEFSDTVRPVESTEPALFHTAVRCVRGPAKCRRVDLDLRNRMFRKRLVLES